MEEDLLNYQSWKDNKVIRPRLKPEIPRTLKNVNSPLIITNDSLASANQNDKWVLSKPQQMNKTVQVCPIMVNRLVGVNILKRRILSNALEEFVDIAEEEEPSTSTQGSTSEFTETESSSVPEP
ncbi:hypothetical protein O0L34_g16896 [Tuta absoluta]|nr:hypothetical protein O0L34_g16896 [Tuta absoluta]